MLINSYIFCGLLYSFYTFYKIFENKESFSILFRDEFGDEEKINLFFAIMFLTNLVAWPIMLINEINNKKDF